MLVYQRATWMRNGATPTPKTTGPCLADFFLRMDDVGLWRGQENKRKTHGKMHQDDAQCTIYVGFSENEVTHSNPKSYGFKKSCSLWPFLWIELIFRHTHLHRWLVFITFANQYKWYIDHPGLVDLVNLHAIVIGQSKHPTITNEIPRFMTVFALWKSLDDHPLFTIMAN